MLKEASYLVCSSNRLWDVQKSVHHDTDTTEVVCDFRVPCCQALGIGGVKCVVDTVQAGFVGKLLLCDVVVGFCRGWCDALHVVVLCHDFWYVDAVLPELRAHVKHQVEHLHGLICEVCNWLSGWLMISVHAVRTVAAIDAR